MPRELRVILGLEDVCPEHFTCHGVAKTYGRRCRNPVDSFRRSEATILLERLSITNPLTKGMLRQLADLILCNRWHRSGHTGQVDELLSKWISAIRRDRECLMPLSHSLEFQSTTIHQASRGPETSNEPSDLYSADTSSGRLSTPPPYPGKPNPSPLNSRMDPAADSSDELGHDPVAQQHVNGRMRQASETSGDQVTSHPVQPEVPPATIIPSSIRLGNARCADDSTAERNYSDGSPTKPERGDAKGFRAQNAELDSDSDFVWSIPRRAPQHIIDQRRIRQCRSHLSAVNLSKDQAATSTKECQPSAGGIMRAESDTEVKAGRLTNSANSGIEHMDSQSTAEVVTHNHPMQVQPVSKHATVLRPYSTQYTKQQQSSSVVRTTIPSDLTPPPKPGDRWVDGRNRETQDGNRSSLPATTTLILSILTPPATPEKQRTDHPRRETRHEGASSGQGTADVLWNEDEQQSQPAACDVQNSATPSPETSERYAPPVTCVKPKLEQPSDTRKVLDELRYTQCRTLWPRKAVSLSMKRWYTLYVGWIADLD